MEQTSGLSHSLSFFFLSLQTLMIRAEWNECEEQPVEQDSYKCASGVYEPECINPFCVPTQRMEVVVFLWTFPPGNSSLPKMPHENKAVAWSTPSASGTWSLITVYGKVTWLSGMMDLTRLVNSFILLWFSENVRLDKAANGFERIVNVVCRFFSSLWPAVPASKEIGTSTPDMSALWV